MDVWTNFEEGKSHILMLLVGNGFGTFDPKINRVSLLFRMDV